MPMTVFDILKDVAYDRDWSKLDAELSEFITWPPDVFALTASLAHRAGTGAQSSDSRTAR